MQEGLSDTQHHSTDASKRHRAYRRECSKLFYKFERDALDERVKDQAIIFAASLFLILCLALFG